MPPLMKNNDLIPILVVDDDAANIKVLVQILRNEEGFAISVANNGLEALKLMKTVKPDLVLLDIMMPELDGYETCQRMKEDEELSNIPVIYLSAKIETEDVVKAFECGAVDYVTKPFNATELMARVRTQLDLKWSHDRINRQLELLTDTEAFLRFKLAKMEADLESAKVVQENLLPHECPTHDSYKIAFRYRPKEVVGGDYICFPSMHKDEQGFFLGDLTGHGVSAALDMALIKFITDRLFDGCSCDPQKLLKELNNKLFGQLSSSFITAVYGILKLDEAGGFHRCILAGAAHPKPILFDYQKKTYSYQNFLNGPAIGILPEFKTDNYSVELRSGSRIYLYTDGLTEAENEEGERLGNERFLKIVEESYDLCVDKTLENVLARVDEYGGSEESSDDVTLFVLEIVPEGD